MSDPEMRCANCSHELCLHDVAGPESDPIEFCGAGTDCYCDGFAPPNPENPRRTDGDASRRLAEARTLVADLAGTVVGLTGGHHPTSAETYRREKAEWCRRVLARAEALLAETPSGGSK